MNFNSKNIERKIGPKFGEKDSILNIFPSVLVFNELFLNLLEDE